MLLEQIRQPNDIKTIEPELYGDLADEIRTFLLEKVSRNGGHLGSNLGAVELTMALHLFMDFPQDKLIWDVGHQAYTHKILTGRREAFDSLRKEGGLSGFPKRKESPCDCFDTGHSSTSLSAGLGFVKARDLKGANYKVVSVIGDGSLTGGLAYEALNNASRLETNYIIVLNDNNMSISENVGGMSKYLNNIRTADKYLGLKEGIYNTLKGVPRYGDAFVDAIRKAKRSVKQLVIPGMFFEDMGITYLGPVDGHNVQAMVKVFREARRCKNAVLVHVITDKGKGYEPAEKNPAKFHGIGAFDLATGNVLQPSDKASYTDVFSSVLCRLAKENESIVGITAAMPDGTGLVRFCNRFPDRFIDVGIAEEHAVTYAAALAADGYTPVVAIYSSFLQRAYDQIIHDVCMQNLHVVFAIDRAGIVGNDGETHQGTFDLSYLSGIPNMTVLAPKNKWELADMLKYAIQSTGPVAIRYPRGEAYDGLELPRRRIETGKAEILYGGRHVALVAVGNMVKTACRAREILAAEGLDITVVNPRFVKPFDVDMIDELCMTHSVVVTVEENVLAGGFGEHVLRYMNERGYLGRQVRCVNLGIPDQFVAQGSVEGTLKRLHLNAESIAEAVRSAWQQYDRQIHHEDTV